MDNKRDCCGNCLYHRKDRDSNEWTCNNEESENYGLETGYCDWCQNHEER